jgi:molybdopterin/thiamine biosynthesis adenylyltransferase
VDAAERKDFADTFYSRQVILKELGAKGQAKLSKAKVAIVGVGGLGTVSSLFLALAGVGYLRLIDQDTIEIQNLHRQILYTMDDLKYPKAEVAAERLQKLNSLVKVEPISENLHASNAETLLKGVDCVVDGLDNMATRYLINRACVKLEIPYVFGAAIGLEGNLTVFSPPETPCLECILPSLSDNDMQRCDTRGVLGATPGIIGAMQAMETLKVLAGIGSPLKGKLMVCDFNDMYFANIDITKRLDCPACHGAQEPVAAGEKLAWLCGRDTANINPEEPLKLDLNKVCEVIQKQQLNIRLRSHFALIFDYKGFEVSLFSSGRMLIKNVTSEEAALKAYREVLRSLHISN